MKPKKIMTLVVSRENSSSLVHSARTTTAAVASLLVARLLRMPEGYWASITALIVMQSTFGAALSISAQRFIGTAVGALLGALAATYFQHNVAVYGTLVFLIGLLCAVLRIDRTAYRYASITLAVVMLIPRTVGPWTAAGHRFVEVSTGIIVALVIAAAWPERLSVTKSISAQASIPAETGS
jgi:uncharacterized membrane protein YccC